MKLLTLLIIYTLFDQRQMKMMMSMIPWLLMRKRYFNWILIIFIFIDAFTLITNMAILFKIHSHLLANIMCGK